MVFGDEIEICFKDGNGCVCGWCYMSDEEFDKYISTINYDYQAPYIASDDDDVFPF